MDVDIEKIRELADLIKDKDLAEIQVTDGEKSVTIKTVGEVSVAAAGAPAPQQVISAPAPAAPPAQAPEAPAAGPAGGENTHTITSPMVGTFYRSPAPDADPFVEVGQSIRKGQTLCILEAMKLMNELESEVDGKVVQVLVENGTPVEFGQPLMVVEKA